MFINGKFTSGYASESIPVINPATEEILGESPRGKMQDTLAAVEAARRALPGWKNTPASERAAYLHQVAASMRDHHEELVRLLTQE